MRKYLSALGCLASLFFGRLDVYASEFILHDPSERPNIALDCLATRSVQSQPQQSTPFHLHVDVNFVEKYAVISPEFGQDRISMALTSIATLPTQETEHLVLTDGSTNALVSMRHEDIILFKLTSKGLEEYTITGKSCRTTLTN